MTESTCRLLILALLSLPAITVAGDAPNSKGRSPLARRLPTNAIFRFGNPTLVGIGKPNPVFEHIEFSPDGSLLAAMSRYRVMVFDIQSASVTRPIRGDRDDDLVGSDFLSNKLMLLASENGLREASLDGETTPKPWPNAHQSKITALAVCSSDAVAASADSSGAVVVWDAPTANPTHVLAAHSNPVVSIAIGTDGKKIATSDSSGQVGYWINEDGGWKKQSLWRQPGAATVIFVAADSQLLCLSNQRIVAIRLSDGAESVPAGLPDDCQVTAAHPIDDSTVLLALYVGFRTLLCSWDLNRHATTDLGALREFRYSVKSMAYGSGLGAIAFASPVGGLVLREFHQGTLVGPPSFPITGMLATEQRLLTVNIEGNRTRWRMGDGKLSMVTPRFPHSERFFGCAHVFKMDPSEFLLLLRHSTNASVVFFDSTTLKQTRSIRLSRNPFIDRGVPTADVACLTGQKRLAYLSDRSLCFVWLGDNVQRSVPLRFIPTCCDATVNGHQIVIGTDDHICFFDDAKPGAATYEQAFSSGAVVTVVKYSRSGRYLAVAGEDTVKIKELQTGESHTLKSPDWGVSSACFLPDREDYLLVGGSSGSLFLWNWRNGKLLGRFKAHFDQVTSILAGSDGVVLTASEDGTVVKWRINPSDH